MSDQANKPFFEENRANKYRQRWLLWRNRTDRRLTEDLLGCGATKKEARKQAKENPKMTTRDQADIRTLKGKLR